MIQRGLLLALGEQGRQLRTYALDIDRAGNGSARHTLKRSWSQVRCKRIQHQGLGVEVHRVVDLRHTIEKLAAAARVLFGEAGSGAEIQRWKLRLLNRTTALPEILAELHASGLERARVGEQMPVHDAITYLSNQGDRMNYAEARRLGLPIGSGNVEATCKTLFEVRLKRAGSRWKETTGEHIVQLRALALSERWAPAMRLTLRPLRRIVKPAA